jgi:DNA-binding IclR family transcriptional regulator
MEPIEGRRSVLGRVFDILECFAEEPVQTISSLCASTDLPPATVHRHLASLVEWGAVERCSRGRYELGRRLWLLGSGVPQVRRLRDIARPRLVDLHVRTGELAALCFVSDQRLQIADIIGGSETSHQWRLPRHVRTPGLAPELIHLAYSKAEVAPGPHGKPLSLSQRSMLHEIRRTGFAVTRSPSANGPCWVAAPVFEGVGQVRSVLTLLVPAARLNEMGMGRLVSEFGRIISKELIAELSAAL